MYCALSDVFLHAKVDTIIDVRLCCDYRGFFDLDRRALVSLASPFLQTGHDTLTCPLKPLMDGQGKQWSLQRRHCPLIITHPSNCCQ